MGNVKDPDYWTALAEKGYTLKGPPAKRDQLSSSCSSRRLSNGKPINHSTRKQRLPLRMVVSEPAYREGRSPDSQENSPYVENLLANPAAMKTLVSSYDLTDLKMRNIISSDIRAWLKDPCSQHYRTTKPMKRNSKSHLQYPDEKHLDSKDKFEDFNRTFQPSLVNEPRSENGQSLIFNGNSEKLECLDTSKPSLFNESKCENKNKSQASYACFEKQLERLNTNTSQTSTPNMESSNAKGLVKTFAPQSHKLFISERRQHHNSFHPSSSNEKKFQSSHSDFKIVQERQFCYFDYIFQPCQIDNLNQPLINNSYKCALDKQTQFLRNESSDNEFHSPLFGKQNARSNMMKGIFPFHKERQNDDIEEDMQLEKQSSSNKTIGCTLVPNSSVCTEQYNISPETDRDSIFNSFSINEDSVTDHNVFNFSRSEGQGRNSLLEHLSSKALEDIFVWNPVSSQNKESTLLLSPVEEEYTETTTYYISPDIFRDSNSQSLESSDNSKISMDSEIQKEDLHSSNASS